MISMPAISSASGDSSHSGLVSSMWWTILSGHARKKKSSPVSVAIRRYSWCSRTWPPSSTGSAIFRTSRALMRTPISCELRKSPTRNDRQRVPSESRQTTALWLNMTVSARVLGRAIWISTSNNIYRQLTNSWAFCVLKHPKIKCKK